MCDTTKSAVLQRNSSLNGIAVPYRVRRAWYGRFTGFIQSSQQPLLDNEGPVPFSARVGRTDPAGLPPVLTICRCFACVGPVPPSAGVGCTDPGGRSFRRCLSAWGLYPLPRVSAVRTPRDVLAATVRVRGGCTPFRGRRLCRPRGTLFQFHNLLLLACKGRVKNKNWQ